MKNTIHVFIALFFSFSLLFSQTETNSVKTNFFNIENLNGTNEQATNTTPVFLEALRNDGKNTNATLTGAFIRSLAGFLFFFALLYIIYRYLKKRSKVVLGTDSVIKVLATTPLAQNRYLSIVEIADEMYLIAVADHNISLISKITDKETIDHIRIAHANSKENIVEDPFNNIFDKALYALNIKKRKKTSPFESANSIKEKIRSLDANAKDKNESALDDVTDDTNTKKRKRR